MCTITKFIRYLIFAWALSCLLFSCSNNDFSSALTKAVEAGRGATIAFRDLTSFEWDTVYVYGPYQSLEQINKKHGTTLKASSLYGSDWVPEGDCLYIFTLHGKAVQSAFHPRYLGSCVDIVDPGLYSKEAAVFEVEVKVAGSHPILKWISSNQSLQSDRANSSFPFSALHSRGQASVTHQPGR
jgi:hypothetical protein